MSDELRERFHRANVALAVTFPVLAVAAFLLRNAEEAVLQGLAVAYFVLVFALFFVLEERAERRRLRQESRDQ